MNKEYETREDISQTNCLHHNNTSELKIIETLSREKLIEHVKKWVFVDNQIKDLNEKIKKYKEFKTKLTPIVSTFIYNLSHKKIDISDGELKLYEKKEYSPLTFTYIENTLNTMFQDENIVKNIIQKLKDNREIHSCTDIRRT